MPDYRETENLEEQLRRDRKLAAARRLRRRLPWAIPLALIVLAVCILLFFLIRHLVLKKQEKNKLPENVDAEATIVFVGDISMDAAMMESFRTDRGYNFDPLFLSVTPQIFAADLAVGNLEGNYSDDAVPADHNYPAAFFSSLRACGFDVLQTANSYSIDNGIAYVSKTREAILDAGMEPVGTFSSEKERNDCGGVLIRDVNGIRVAFIALTKSMNGKRLPEDADYAVNLLYEDYYETGTTNFTKLAKDSILELIDNAKAENPDVIIALVHWGSEYEDVTDAQKKAAALLFENGVDLIVGQHSHLVGPMRQEKDEPLPHSISNGFVAYSLGDFLSSESSLSGHSGCILSIRLLKHNGKITVASIEYTPTFSAFPDEDLQTDRYEILDSKAAIADFEGDYYDKISQPLYDLLNSSVEKLRERTGWSD